MTKNYKEIKINIFLTINVKKDENIKILHQKLSKMMFWVTNCLFENNLKFSTSKSSSLIMSQIFLKARKEWKVIIISSAWSSGIHSIQSLLYYSTIFSKYSPQTSQNQCLEKASNGLCVGATPYGLHTLHRAEMTPPPPPLLDCTVYTVY